LSIEIQSPNLGGDFMKIRFIGVFIAFLVLPVFAHAAWMDPVLVDAMNSSADEFIPTLIFLKEQVDLDRPAPLRK
jgi:hypothetical protein